MVLRAQAALVASPQSIHRIGVHFYQQLPGLEQGDWLTSMAVFLLMWAVNFCIIWAPKRVKDAVFFLKVSGFVSLPVSVALAQ